ncbi:hypothetical protein CMI37_19325 [Candidatus Pacearchaeota archaeon]|nr:hypothetical protein [Candidatus Pacearchaeota archaeon]
MKTKKVTRDSLLPGIMKDSARANRAEFNFVWIFAIIAGIAILILAVYGAVRVADTKRLQTDTEVAKEISIITDPLQAGFGEGRFGKIIFRSETRVNNYCYDDEFGKNEISVATRSRIGEEWSLAGGATSVHNKYIFSSPQNSGKEYYVFSKPFEFPYKVADLIFLTQKKYCFINTPDEIENEILGLAVPNIAIENCTGEEDEVRVCFGAGGCSGRGVVVYGGCVSGCGGAGVWGEGFVLKDGERLEYVGSLMYGAIFSEKDIYDCNVKRLMYRTAKISEVFGDKADLMNARECNTNLKADLRLLGGLAMNATAEDLMMLNDFVKQVEIKADREVCGLW